MDINTPDHTAPITNKAPVGVLRDLRSYLMQGKNGQTLGTYFVSVDLNYPGIGPKHNHLDDIRRIEYAIAKDGEAPGAFDLLCCFKGIVPVLELSHAPA